MSRHPRDYSDRYDDRETEIYRRPRRERERDREYEELDIDISRQRYPESRRAETVVKERDTVVSDRRTERGPRVPDFLREDYGKSSSAGALVVREDKREEDVYSRAPTRRRSNETMRSRAPPERERVEKDKFVFESDRGPPYPRSQRSDVAFRETDEEDREIIYRERPRSRAPPREEREKEEIDITIRREESRPPPPPSEAPIEEIRFRRGGGDRPAPPRTTVDKTEIDIREQSQAPSRRARTVVDREEIDIRESRRSPPPRSNVDRDEFEFRERRSSRGRGKREEIDIDIRERSAPPPRQRSMSRGNLVARKNEEWIVRRERTPPPQDYEKEEIIIRRSKEKSPSPEPEPPREPTPEPPPPPPPEPIYRPPIIQEVITHHRHIDHPFERARSPTPPPPQPPTPPPPPKETKEDNLEIEIRRKGTRNGRPFEEDITFERDTKEREESREVARFDDRKRSISVNTRRRSPSAGLVRRRYEDEMESEAEYYNRKIASRAYPGEAYNGATKDWGLVDVPPGTERVRMDGIGGGAQEISWQRYNGERRGKFISGDRVYEAEYGNGYSSPPPLPIAPPPPREAREEKEEIKITHTRGGGEEKPRKRDKMWTEVTKDLVIKEAIDEMGYECEETDEHFYIIEYLKYVSRSNHPQVTEYQQLANNCFRKMFSAWWRLQKTSNASAVNVSVRYNGRERSANVCQRCFLHHLRYQRRLDPNTTSTFTRENTSTIATAVDGDARNIVVHEIVVELLRRRPYTANGVVQANEKSKPNHSPERGRVKRSTAWHELFCDDGIPRQPMTHQ